MADCPTCNYHKQRAQLWRDEAYRLAGHPLPERDPVLEEREACAKICETGLPIATSLSALDDMEMWGEKFAVAIRARGQA